MISLVDQVILARRFTAKITHQVKNLSENGTFNPLCSQRHSDVQYVHHILQIF